MPQKKTLIEWIGRTGLVARAVVYFLIGIILCLGVFLRTEPSDGASPSEGFENVAGFQFGGTAVICIGIGLLAYTLFRFTQAAQDNAQDGLRSFLARLGMISSGLSYAAVGLTAFSVALDRNEESSSGATRSTVAALLEQPFGNFLIGAFGLIITAIGIAQIYRVVSRQWTHSLDLEGVDQRIIFTANFAIAGRGLLIVLIGLSILWAGWDSDVDDAMGLTQVLGWLRDQAFGAYLYLTAGLIMTGYGVYGILQAVKYRFEKP